MSIQVVTHGTLKPDGTLELDEKVAMPAGQVQVTIQPVVQPNPDDPFWQRLEAIWAGQRARGYVPRSRDEIDRELQQLKEDAEAEMQATERLYQECRRARQETEETRGKP